MTHFKKGDWLDLHVEYGSESDPCPATHNGACRHVDAYGVSMDVEDSTGVIERFFVPWSRITGIQILWITGEDGDWDEYLKEQTLQEQG